MAEASGGFSEEVADAAFLRYLEEVRSVNPASQLVPREQAESITALLEWDQRRQQRRAALAAASGGDSGGGTSSNTAGPGASASSPMPGDFGPGKRRDVRRDYQLVNGKLCRRCKGRLLPVVVMEDVPSLLRQAHTSKNHPKSQALYDYVSGYAWGPSCLPWFLPSMLRGLHPLCMLRPQPPPPCSCSPQAYRLRLLACSLQFSKAKPTDLGQDSAGRAVVLYGVWGITRSVCEAFVALCDVCADRRHLKKADRVVYAIRATKKMVHLQASPGSWWHGHWWLALPTIS